MLFYLRTRYAIAISWERSFHSSSCFLLSLCFLFWRNYWRNQQKNKSLSCYVTWVKRTPELEKRREVGTLSYDYKSNPMLQQYKSSICPFLWWSLQQDPFQIRKKYFICSSLIKYNSSAGLGRGWLLCQKHIKLGKKKVIL